MKVFSPGLAPAVSLSETPQNAPKQIFPSLQFGSADSFTLNHTTPPSKSQIKFGLQRPIKTTPSDYVDTALSFVRQDPNARLLVSTDVDGTLTPFVPNVDDANLTPQQTEDLLRLARLLYTRFATPLVVNTGRDAVTAVNGLGGAEALLGQPIIVITDQGLKGVDFQKTSRANQADWVAFEVPGSEEIFEKIAPFKAAMLMQKDALASLGTGKYEEKAGGVAVNVGSLNTEQQNRVVETFIEEANNTGLSVNIEIDGFKNDSPDADFRLVYEKAVVELKPNKFNKGTACEKISEHFAEKLNAPIISAFWGDSDTDNPGFKSAPQLSLYVGSLYSTPTRWDGRASAIQNEMDIAAKYYFPNPRHTDGFDVLNPQTGRRDDDTRRDISLENTRQMHTMIDIFGKRLTELPKRFKI